MSKLQIKLTQIFKKLKIINPLAVSTHMISDFKWYIENPFKYDEISKTIAGGAESDGIDGIVFKYKNINFIFFKHSDEYNIIFSIFREDNDDNKSCCVIMINREEHSAYISGISYDKKCFTNAQINAFKSDATGKLLLRASLAFIDKMKDHYKLKYIYLKDNSSKPCKIAHDNIPLGTFLMFVSGNTWYGKYGFIPFNYEKQITDTYKLKKYKNNQEIIKTTKIKDTNIKKYIGKAIKKLNISSKGLDDYVDERLNMTILKFMKEFSIDYDVFCGIFYYIYRDIMDDLKIYNLHETIYWKEL